MNNQGVNSLAKTIIDVDSDLRISSGLVSIQIQEYSYTPLFFTFGLDLNLE